MRLDFSCVVFSLCCVCVCPLINFFKRANSAAELDFPRVEVEESPELAGEPSFGLVGGFAARLDHAQKAAVCEQRLCESHCRVKSRSWDTRRVSRYATGAVEFELGRGR